MSNRSASKVPPCVTIMVCVAGCSTSGPEQLPYSRTLPPPDFYKKPINQEPLIARHAPERPAPKPITVDVPMEVLVGPARVEQLVTQFESVPNSYLGLPDPAAGEAAIQAYFTPLKTSATPLTVPPAPKLQTAEKLLEPLIEQQTTEAVILPEPIAYPQYVSVGPEYFGPDSDIAPYVISRSESPQPERRQYAEARQLNWRPEVIKSETGKYSVTTELVTPLPRSAPSPNAPGEPAPQQMVETVALAPPRPTPQVPRTPNTLPPLSPSRPGADRSDQPKAREERDVAATADNSSAWKDAATPKDASDVEAIVATFPETSEPVYRVLIGIPEQQETEVASLDPAIGPIETAPLPRIEIVEPNKVDQAPLAAVAAPATTPSVKVSGTVTGVAQAPLAAPVTAPANDPKTTTDCHVNLGSKGRMVIVCKGVKVSRPKVLRAVVEAESALRGQRAFDTTDKIVAAYGFHPSRFGAMSQGPKSSLDLAFLRALRNSGRRIRIKRRTFDLYLMKGDLHLATVLIERAESADAASAAAQGR